jgi:hypothetical protein
MTPGGWITLILSLAFVWGLTIWCFYKVLTAPEPPDEEFEHFRSA